MTEAPFAVKRPTRRTARPLFSLRPFVAEDYVVIARTLALTYDVPRVAREMADGGPGYTLCFDGYPVASAGIVVPWDGLGIAWALVSASARQGSALHRVVRWGLREIIRTRQLRRVEAVVRADYWVGRRWLQVLGFEEESQMPHYGPTGEDFVRVVLFPKEGG
jgi:hypothetical protein